MSAMTITNQHLNPLRQPEIPSDYWVWVHDKLPPPLKPVLTLREEGKRMRVLYWDPDVKEWFNEDEKVVAGVRRWWRNLASDDTRDHHKMKELMEARLTTRLVRAGLKEAIPAPAPVTPPVKVDDDNTRWELLGKALDLAKDMQSLLTRITDEIINAPKV